jgi:hypothetical protein
LQARQIPKARLNMNARSRPDSDISGKNGLVRSFSIRPPMSSTTRPTTIMLALQ